MLEESTTSDRGTVSRSQLIGRLDLLLCFFHHDLLARQKWHEADEETRRVMLQVAGREKGRWLRVEDVQNFPCEDLRTIDRLWVQYSDGCFGFSIQKKIYQSLGGTEEYNTEIWRAFGDRVGWRRKGAWLDYRDLSFSLMDKTPTGLLPGWFWFCWGVGVVWFSSLASRLRKCNL